MYLCENVHVEEDHKIDAVVKQKTREKNRKIGVKSCATAS